MIHNLWDMNLLKKPSIRATVDIKTLLAFNAKDLDDKTFNETVSVVLKNESDKKKVLKKFVKENNYQK